MIILREEREAGRAKEKSMRWVSLSGRNRSPSVCVGGHREKERKEGRKEKASAQKRETSNERGRGQREGGEDHQVLSLPYLLFGLDSPFFLILHLFMFGLII